MKKSGTETRNMGEGKNLPQHKNDNEGVEQNVELCEETVLNTESFIGTGLVPIAQAEINPATLDGVCKKTLNQKFNEAGYQWPAMKKTNSYMRKKKPKSFNAYIICVYFNGGFNAFLRGGIQTFPVLVGGTFSVTVRGLGVDISSFLQLSSKTIHTPS